MTYGYSARTIHFNKQADKTRLGVALGRASIELGIPVADLAGTLGVSRQTVYNWFIGIHEPREKHVKTVLFLLNDFTKELKETNLK